MASRVGRDCGIPAPPGVRRGDSRTLAATAAHRRRARVDGTLVLRHGAVGRSDRLHRLFERRHHLAGLEDRLPRRCDPAKPADRHHHRRAAVRGTDRTNPHPAQRRHHRLRAADQQGTGGRRPGRPPPRCRKFPGHAAGRSGGAVGQYLVDSGGTPVYLVDPGINGTIAGLRTGRARSRNSTRRRPR